MHNPTSDRAIVIYHDNCMDGFASAWAFHTLMESGYAGGVQYLPYKYGMDPIASMNFIEHDVFILDFSFPRDALEYICNTANHVTLLDHHKTAAADLADTINWETKPANLTIVFDMARSGAGITWDYFYESRNGPTYGETNRPKLISYVEDRDLWLFVWHASKAVNAVVAITPRNFKSYTRLAAQIEESIENIINIGEHLDYQHKQIASEIVKECREITIFEPITDDFEVDKEFKGLASNCSPQFSSEVGNILALNSGTFGATYWADHTGAILWSLRSVGDYDVSAIAKIFGGGGHKNAAGFKVFQNLGPGIDPAKIELRVLEE